MEITVLIFLTSGLFLGWSLGANDAANVFGTAVASRMIQFTTAAIICSIFLILGAVISGAGAAHGLGAWENSMRFRCIHGGVFRCLDRLLDDQNGSSCFHHPGDCRCHHRLESI